MSKESNGNTETETSNVTNNSVSRSNDNASVPVEPEPTDNGEPNEKCTLSLALLFSLDKKIHKRFRKIITSLLSLRTRPMKVKKLRKRVRLIYFFCYHFYRLFRNLRSRSIMIKRFILISSWRVYSIWR